MKQRFYALALLLCVVAPSWANSLKYEPIIYQNDNFTIQRDSKLKLEGFYSKNVRLLNNDNKDLDKVIIPGKFTLDNDIAFKLENPECGWTTLGLDVNVRFKGVFGAPEDSYRTGFSTIKDLEAVTGSHTHPINVHIPVLRKLKMDINLNELLEWDLENEHTLTLGLFPFSLGRGISLGSAYATVPDFLGYDPASSIEQFAPGILFSGSVLTDHDLDYDLYASVLDNLSGSFSAVNEKTQGQMYGHRFNQARDFGVINYIVAGRLRWTPVDEECCKVYIEPYALYNDERDQKIEFSGDATMKLGTFGFAMEVTKDCWEFGFDVAHNVGKQYVKGLDRNIIEKELRNGQAYWVNSKVTIVSATDDGYVSTDNDGLTNTNNTLNKKVVYSRDTTDQKAIQAEIGKDITSSQVCDSLSDKNGKSLSPVAVDGGNVVLKNAADRYRDAYCNDLEGYMLVADMLYKVCPGLKVAGTVGYATGDENPNKDLNELNESNVDGNYKGFISLQELYSGKRVKSAFLLSGKGKIPRLLSFPINKDSGDINSPAGGYPAIISRFSNIVFLGASAYWDLETCSRTWSFNPNVLTYWQDHATRIFDIDEQERITNSCARRHLGTEVNLYVDSMVLKGLNAFLVAGVFFSGSHYDDVKGRPINKSEQKFLDASDKTGVMTDFVPVLGNDNAFFVNMGLEYKF